MSLTLLPTDIDRLATDAVKMYEDSHKDPPAYILGIPRGGMAVAYRIANEFERRHPDRRVPSVGRAEPQLTWQNYPGNALVVDDIVDSGRTLEPFILHGFETLSLVVKKSCPEHVKPLAWGTILNKDQYVNFPWDEKSQTPEDAVVRLLEYIGVNPNDPSVKETPRRFLSWLNEFRLDQPEPDITTFEGIQYDQMVLVRDIPFLSLCEHHLMIFRGTAAVAYIPDASKVIGLSKIARIVQHYARRPQVQERLTEQVRNAVADATGCQHVAVLMRAEHTCMSLRGPRVEGHATITSSLMGDFRADQKTREEFLKLTS